MKKLRYPGSNIRNGGHDGYRMRVFEDSYSLTEGVTLERNRYNSINIDSFGHGELKSLNACLRRRGLVGKKSDWGNPNRKYMNLYSIDNVSDTSWE